jgi:hypothetical protein
MSRRTRIVVLVSAFAVVAAISAAVGVVGAVLVRSPAEVARDADPPEPSLLAVAVEQGPLTRTVTLRGTIEPGSLFDIVPAPPANGLAAYVTAAPRPVGSAVGAGDAVIEIADRPVFLLPGAIPLLRDLDVGATGPDVLRFQDSLRAAGAAVTDAPGRFGSSTRHAVLSLYEAAGYAAPVWGVPLVSRAEFILVPGTLPARIAAYGAGVGEAVSSDSPPVVVTTSGPRVVADANPVDARELAVGMSVVIGGVGDPIAATIRSIGDAEEVEGSGLRTRIVATTDAVLDEHVGDAVQVVIDLTDEQVEGVVVPISAVRSRADGSAFVTLVSRGATQDVETEDIGVEVLDTADGMALVHADGVDAGDRVAIGIRG